MHSTACAGHRAGAFGIDHAGHQRGAAFRLHRDLAALRTVGAEAAAGFEGDVPLRPQDNFTAGITHDLIGIDDARIAQCCAVNADLSAPGKYFAEVDRGVIARGDFDPHTRCAGVDDFYRLTGCEYHAALRTVDDAAVGDVGADQIDAASGRSGDGAQIFHVAGEWSGGEIESPSEKILVAQVKRGCHQSGNVNARTVPDQNAAWIDQENPAIRQQCPENYRRIGTDDAIEDARDGTLLDEARGFACADREPLPIDDRAGAVGDIQRFTLIGEAGLSANHHRPRAISQRVSGVEYGSNGDDKCFQPPFMRNTITL